MKITYVFNGLNETSVSEERKISILLKSFLFFKEKGNNKSPMQEIINFDYFDKNIILKSASGNYIENFLKISRLF